MQRSTTAILAFLCAPLWAAADDDPGLLAKQRAALSRLGIAPYATWSGEFFSNLRGGIRTGTVWEGLLEFGVDVDLEKAASLPNTSLHVSGVWLFDNEDPSADLVGNFDEVSNIAGVEEVRFFQAYVKHQPGGGRFTVKAGQLALDDDFMVSTGASLFLNASFGPLPLLTGNTLAPTYPIGGLGAWVQWQANKDCSIQAGLYDGNAGTEIGNPSGLEYGIGTGNGAALLIEASLNGTLFRRDNTLKIGGFFNTGEFVDYASNAVVRNDAALYFILDQVLVGTRDSSLLAVFVRAGFSPYGSRNQVTWYFDAGLTARGFRDGDQCGLALTHAAFGDAFAAAQRAGGTPVTSSETVLELTYLLQLTPWFALQPDIQFVMNPQNAAASNALVAGIRGKITF